MSFTIKGKITSIGEVRALENGAKVIDFRVETSEQYANLYSFDMYKAADRAEHVDNFIKYNKVGDNVRVEWNVRTNDYNGRFFTSLSPWRVEKLGQVETPTEIQQEVEDDLPF